MCTISTYYDVDTKEVATIKASQSKFQGLQVVPIYELFLTIKNKCYHSITKKQNYVTVCKIIENSVCMQCWLWGILI